MNACLRESGTTNYQAAFMHILRTRPDLFAGMQDPSGVVAAANFNPYHDPLGRFTTSDDAVAPHGRGLLPDRGVPSFLRRMDGLGQHRHHGEQLAQRQEGKETPAPRTIPSIKDHALGSRSLATCVVAAVRSLIATLRAATNDHRPPPSEEEVEKQFAAALGKDIDWSRGMPTPLNDGGVTFARVVKDVLAQNGVPSLARFNYPSAKALADEIRTAGVPVIADVIVSRQGATVYGHAVLIQWDQENKRFLVSNIDTQGTTTPYTQRQFESGTIQVVTGRTGVSARASVDIDFHNAVIFAQKP